MYRAWSHIRQGDPGALSRWLLITTILGSLFLTVQGIEWFRLISFGLTANANVYGATFYVIVGFHALHVMAAVGALLYVLRRSTFLVYTAKGCSGVSMCALFWLFVVLIWPVIFLTVYLL